MRGGVLPRGQGIFAQALGSVLFPGCPGGCSPGQAVGRSVSPQTAEGRGGLWSPGSSACTAGPWQHRWLSQGCPSQGTRLVSTVCLHLSCCPWCLQLAARWLPRRSVPIAGRGGRQRGSGSLQVPGAELSSCTSQHGRSAGRSRNPHTLLATTQAVFRGGKSSLLPRGI